MTYMHASKQTKSVIRDVMISLKFQIATLFEQSSSTREFHVPIRERVLMLGRGQESMEESINLQELSRAVSRTHACFCFSPQWFLRQSPTIPHYLSAKFSHFPLELLAKIWAYAQPKKLCVFKDLHSRLGIHRRIGCECFEAGLAILIADGYELMVEHKEIYDTHEEAITRINEMGPYKVMNSTGREKEFWRVSIKEQKYALMCSKEQRKLTIGRSSQCDLQIKVNAVSRIHAMLLCSDHVWRIVDGNGMEKSINGLWKKVKIVQIPTNSQEVFKVADLLMKVEVKEDPSFFNFEEMMKGDESDHIQGV